MTRLFYTPLLFADLGDVIGVLVGLVFLIMWVVRQIGEARKQMARPRGQPPAAPPRPGAPADVPPRPQPRAAMPAGQQADPLRSQVEEFLRRAKQQPPPAKQAPTVLPRPPRRVRQSEIEVLVDDEPAPQERRSLAEPLRPIEQTEIARPLLTVPGRAAESSKSSVAGHVAEHISASATALSQHSALLGQRIVAEDEEFDEQLKSRFGHAVGTLAASRSSDPALQSRSADDSPAAQIARMLARPEGMRQAVVINEILRRPIDHWS